MHLVQCYYKRIVFSFIQVEFEGTKETKDTLKSNFHWNFEVFGNKVSIHPRAHVDKTDREGKKWLRNLYIDSLRLFSITHSRSRS